MPLQPVTRRSVPDEVFDQVLDEVVDGGLAAGEALPSERRLAEVLGVSRPAVREALQRMAQTRLVEVRHRGGGAPAPPSGRRAGGGRRPAWSRSGTAGRPPSATSAATPGSTCSPRCWCAA